MSALEQELGMTKRRGRCDICGAPTEASVVLRLQKTKDRGAGRSKTESRSFCGEHAVVVFRSALAALENDGRAS